VHNASPHERLIARTLCRRAGCQQRLSQRIVAEIHASGGWISFARYMELALYHGARYYAGGSRKFGTEATSLPPGVNAAVRSDTGKAGRPDNAAFNTFDNRAGAGSGRLAADLLLALDALGCARSAIRYSNSPASCRHASARPLAKRAGAFRSGRMANRIADSFSGCLIGNEVLDAMPVHEVAWHADGINEVGVALDPKEIHPCERDAEAHLAKLARTLDVTAPYHGEIGLAYRSWVAEMTRRLQCGAYY